MSNLEDEAMKFQGVMTNLLQGKAEFSSLVDEMEVLFRNIYQGKIPSVKLFRAIADKYEYLFEEHAELEQAFYEFTEVYEKEAQRQLRGEVVDKLSIYLKDKWQDRRCPVCGKDSWLVPNSIFQLMEFSSTRGLVIGGDMSVYLVVPVVCENCSYTHMFSATGAGVVKGTENWPRLASS